MAGTSSSNLLGPGHQSTCEDRHVIQSLFIQHSPNPEPSARAVIHTPSGQQVVHDFCADDMITVEGRPPRGMANEGSTSYDTLTQMIQAVREESGFTHALLGELCGADWNQIQTLVVDTTEGPADNFQYALKGTPCQEVFCASCVAFTDRVWKLFPEDVLLEQMGIEGYVGVPIYDDVGRPLGIMVLLHQRPITFEEARTALRLLVSATTATQDLLTRNRKHRDVEAVLSSLGTLDVATSKRTVLAGLTRAMMVRGAFLIPTHVDARPNEPIMVRQGADDSADPMPPLSDSLIQKTHEAREAFMATLTPGDGWAESDHPDVLATIQELTHAIVIPLMDDEHEVIGVAGILHESPLNPRILELPILSLIADKLTMLLREENTLHAKTQMEERSRKLEQLESLGLLAAGIAHDFNNILVGVLGNADYLLATLHPSADEDTADSLRDIKEAAQAANGLCKQLMLYAGRSRVELSPFDLTTSLSDLVRLSESTLHIPCLFRDKHATSPIYISGDETQIRQVLMNLLTNARDALGPDGLVEVSVSSVLVSATGLSTFSGVVPAGKYAVVTVKDNGCGIPESKLARIFEPFFTTKGTGHGLGLAGVLGLIRTHDGWLDVQSDVNQGTQFDVYLPQASLPGHHATAPTATAQTPAHESRPTLLVVDDDPRIRRVLTKFASRAGYDTILAENGAEAVELFKLHQSQISGVILDLNMPICDGGTCFDRLRELDPSLPILVSSGNLENPIDAPKLPKPYSFETFKAKAATLIRANA